VGRVTITSVERKTTDDVVTNESGLYLKERLLPGVDEVNAELEGFNSAVFPSVRGKPWPGSARVSRTSSR
jgi:hypothetical protein